MRTVTLREVLEPRNDIVHPRDNPTGDGTFVGLEHIEPHTGRRIGSLPIRLEDLTGRKARFYRGDIVYGYLRPYLNKVWVADFDGYCSVDQYVFRTNGDTDAAFMAAFVRSPQFLERAPIGESPGQLPRIRLDEVLAVEVAIPEPLDQQSVGAALAHQLLIQAHARENARDRRAELELLRDQAVADAFSGVDCGNRVPLSQLGSLMDGDWILNADYAPSGVRLLQVGDVGRGVIIVKSKRHVSVQRAQELHCTLLRTADILISRMAEPIGRAALLPDLGYPAITAVDVSIFRPRLDVVDSEFVVAFMNSRGWHEAVSAQASGATRPRISRTNLGERLVPCPPLPEQRRIAAELRERLATIDQMTRAIDAQLEAIEALPAALLRRAFAEIEAA